MECKFQTWKSLNIRNLEDLKVVCIKKKNGSRGQTLIVPYPCVTLIPPRWCRIIAAVMAVKHFSSSFLLNFYPAGKPHAVHMMEPIHKDNTHLATRAELHQGFWKRQLKEVIFCIQFKERKDAGRNQASRFVGTGIICLSSLLFRQRKK